MNTINKYERIMRIEKVKKCRSRTHKTFSANLQKASLTLKKRADEGTRSTENIKQIGPEKNSP